MAMSSSFLYNLQNMIDTLRQKSIKEKKIILYVTMFLFGSIIISFWIWKTFIPMKSPKSLFGDQGVNAPFTVLKNGLGNTFDSIKKGVSIFK